jgi:NAD(P)-dependent dehydrogenase (short-subunit alcohol dehydrogenase family)
VLTQKIDVADEHAVTAGMAEAVAKMGRLDTVIANAGVGGGAPSFSQFSTETYRRVLSVNLDGVFFTFREACKHMVERASAGDPGGSLVVTSSLSAIDGAARNEAYAATKGAVISMIRAIAVEHARYGVRANAILPGWIATDMTAGAQGNDKFNDAVIKRVPFRRWGEPEDFGGMAVYLASDASSFHTGDSFLIDGGYAIF